VETLIEVEAEGIHKLLGFRNLFLYATEHVKLSEAVAFALIAVARKSKAIPTLRHAIRDGKISPSKASRVAAHITNENAEELIEFTRTHTTKQIDFEIAKRSPKASTRDRVKPISEDLVEIKVTISRKGYENLQRAQSLMAQKGKPSTLGATIEAETEFYLNAQDPVRKAKRSQAKRVCLNRVNKSKSAMRPATSIKRRPLNAAQRQAVHSRDEGRCTHRGADGKRCNSDRWVDIHHIILVSQGGSNDPENLTTLCSFHHDLVHQLSFGIDGQVNWFR
jgi:predicted restriction endonuclease